MTNEYNRGYWDGWDANAAATRTRLDNTADLEVEIERLRSNVEFYSARWQQSLTAEKAVTAKLNEITRLVNGIPNDIDGWARVYVAQNPDAVSRKIPAIKALRAEFPGTGLREAKDAIERALDLTNDIPF